MNIDRQGAAVAPRVEKSTIAFARPTAVEGGTSGTDNASPSFSSVLTALEPEARSQPGPGAPDLPVPGAQAGSVPEMLDTTAPDLTELLSQNLSQNLVQPPQHDAEASLPGQADVSGLFLPAVPMVMDARTVLTVPADALSEPTIGGGSGGGLVASRPLAPPTGSRPDLPTVTLASTMAAGTGVEPKVRPTRLRGEQGESATSALAFAGGSSASMHGDGAQLAVENAKGDWRTTLAVQSERMASMSAPAPGEDGGGFRSLPGLRATERQTGRSVFLPLEGPTAGVGATSSYSTGAAPGAGTVVGAEVPFAASSSSEVAQKVHYWITRGTQTAELQLDAFGGGGVDVSIVMQGKEALVEFRSDQPEARRMLQDAMPQLKDMLQSEGLQLSSGFVGTSAQQDPHARRDGAEMARDGRAGVVAVPGQSGDSGRRATASQTHALDVFV